MSELTEKMQELREVYINDNGYLYDALWECLNDIRAVINASSIDDKLAAVDALSEKINVSIRNESQLEQEAQNALDGGFAGWSDIYASENKGR